METSRNERSNKSLLYLLLAIVSALIISEVHSVSDKCVDKVDTFEDESTKKIFILGFATSIISVVAGTVATIYKALEN